MELDGNGQDMGGLGTRFGNCAGMRLMLSEACWTKGVVTRRHIGK